MCQPLIQDTGREYIVYIEFFVRSNIHVYGPPENVKRPRVRCDNESIAAWVNKKVEIEINAELNISIIKNLI